MKDNFSTWLRHEKFTIGLAIFCALFPILFSIDWNIEIKDENNIMIWILRQIGQFPYQIVNILFIFITLAMLAKTSLLIGKDEDKVESIHDYVKSTFGENSTLARNTSDNLFKRLNIAVQQFYFSWLAVWAIWLVLYIVEFIFSIYKTNIFNNGSYVMAEHQIFRFECLLENTLNLINSFILFFIYLVITVSTVRVGSFADNSRRTMHIGVCFFILLGMLCFSIDVFSLSSLVGPDKYQEIQFFIRLFIGIIATMSLMAVLGRLNTSFLNIPQWLVMCLYLYASVQMIYPLTYNAVTENYKENKEKDNEASKNTFIVMNCIHNNTTDTIPNNGLQTFNSSTIVQATDKEKVKKEENPKEKSINNNEYSYAKHLAYLISILAFLGKGCLFLVLRWIAKKKRFLFFLIHKANSLSDSDEMLRRFNKYYEGCPDQ